MQVWQNKANNSKPWVRVLAEQHNKSLFLFKHPFMLIHTVLMKFWIRVLLYIKPTFYNKSSNRIFAAVISKRWWNLSLSFLVKNSPCSLQGASILWKNAQCLLAETKCCTSDIIWGAEVTALNPRLGLGLVVLGLVMGSVWCQIEEENNR